MLNRHDPTYWLGKRVLVTGHTGFKGSWVTTRLLDLGAQVLGVSLPGGHGSPSLWDQLGLENVTEIRADIASTDWVRGVRAFSPQVVLHLAAQSLVTEGYRDPTSTFRTNVMGTVEVLRMIADLEELQAAVIVTTDKVYDVRQPPPFVEEHFLGGRDPYSASKACAELVTQSWPRLNVPVATARAGNVIGGGDWSLHRIVPDIVRAWTSGRTLALRRPVAIRPWQHVIEPLEGYLAYVQALANREDMPRTLNFGPATSQAVSVLRLVEFAAGEWRRLSGGATPKWEVLVEPDMAETHGLVLDSSLAEESLGWIGTWDWRQAMSKTLEWYLAAAAGAQPADLIRRQFAEYLG
jgi:CDP-glucose 4,6-dehydratase